MCTSLYRACLHEVHDPELLASTTFLTGLFDWTENKRPEEIVAYLPTLSSRLLFFLKSVFLPMLQLRPVLQQVEKNTTKVELHCIGLTVTFTAWMACLFSELSLENGSDIGWTFFLFFIFHITLLRRQIRTYFNVYGWIVSDFFSTLVMYPFVISQAALECAVFMSPEVGQEEMSRGEYQLEGF